MNETSETTALERFLQPLPRALSAELARALADFRADARTQARYDELAQKRTEGSLDASELDELEGLVRANTLIGFLKAEAHAIIATPRH